MEGVVIRSSAPVTQTALYTCYKTPKGRLRNVLSNTQYNGQFGWTWFGVFVSLFRRCSSVASGFVYRYSYVKLLQFFFKHKTKQCLIEYSSTIANTCHNWVGTFILLMLNISIFGNVQLWQMRSHIIDKRILRDLLYQLKIGFHSYIRTIYKVS